MGIITSITMNYSVLAVVLLSLGSALAIPAFLKDDDMCEQLGCFATTTTEATEPTGPTEPTDASTKPTDASTITTDAADATTVAPDTNTTTTVAPETNTTTTVAAPETNTTTTAVAPETNTTTTIKQFKEDPTTKPTTTISTVPPTGETLTCTCGGDDGGESSGANHVLSIAVMAAGFFLSFLL